MQRSSWYNGLVDVATARNRGAESGAMMAREINENRKLGIKQEVAKEALFFLYYRTGPGDSTSTRGILDVYSDGAKHVNRAKPINWLVGGHNMARL